MMYDIIIIGAGPAGISAGLYAVSRGKKTLVIEKHEVGGLIKKVSSVTHYSGLIEQETGATFAARLKKQAENAGVSIVQETVTEVSLTPTTKTVTTDTHTYEAPRIILACGTTPRRLGIPGELELSGKGVCQNATKDAPLCAGKHVYVVGGADGAIKEALYLAGFAKKLTILHFEEQLGCIAEFKEKLKKAENIEVCLSSRLHAIHGTDQIETLEIKNEIDSSITTIQDPGCQVFIYAGSTPNTELFTELSLEDGYIPTNERMETSIPGVYAAGDIRMKQVRQAATAVSDGAIAAINASM